MKYFLYCLQHYADFNGRARRSEFWYFVLFNSIISLLNILLISFIASLIGISKDTLSVLIFLYPLFSLIPWCAVTVRRLHDIGYNGWWLLFLSLLPFCRIILIGMLCTDSKPDTNKYGSNPKDCL